MSSGKSLEPKVLAVASHVVHGFVGNTMVAFVLQSLGIEVGAINTVNLSNHKGYRQFKGSETTAEEIRELYDGLKQSYLADYNILLSGFMPSATVVEAVGNIAQDLRRANPLFWALDPVLGDNGRLYVPDSEVPAYRALLPHADLVLPNQFEAEALTSISIKCAADLIAVITDFHQRFRVPHVVITSLQFEPGNDLALPDKLTCIGSTARSDGTPRLFRVDVPVFPASFAGTGDMFAALTVARLREASAEMDLLGVESWRPPDSLGATNLPLATATEKVLASMADVLEDTTRFAESQGAEMDRLRLAKAREVRVVQNVRALRDPRRLFKSTPL